MTPRTISFAAHCKIGISTTKSTHARFRGENHRCPACRTAAAHGRATNSDFSVRRQTTESATLFVNRRRLMESKSRGCFLGPLGFSYRRIRCLIRSCVRLGNQWCLDLRHYLTLNRRGLDGSRSDRLDYRCCLLGRR